MSELSTEDWMSIFFFITFCMWSISVLLFGRITVKHIEREMAKEDILPAEWDKGIGMRYPAYASIIMRPNAKRHASIVDIEATKRFSRKVDWYLAVFVQISSVVFFTLMFTVAYLYGPDS
ncbi:hypothetical protein EGC86_09790 [Shewanella frigidimarina]|uniref:hypothetical protein n=1 Tax=Shewanella frigidimarina TaxID=56812 RepID=UPI000F50646C|nr:hypothetical protein [Shewanella frigidimarina]RPA61356.1 hypothetical protein EGC86_09790 [Shewanella frigidimarina]